MRPVGFSRLVMYYPQPASAHLSEAMIFELFAAVHAVMLSAFSPPLLRLHTHGEGVVSIQLASWLQRIRTSSFVLDQHTVALSTSLSDL